MHLSHSYYKSCAIWELLSVKSNNSFQNDTGYYFHVDHSLHVRVAWNTYCWNPYLLDDWWLSTVQCGLNTLLTPPRTPAHNSLPLDSSACMLFASFAILKWKWKGHKNSGRAVSLVISFFLWSVPCTAHSTVLFPCGVHHVVHNFPACGFFKL